VWTILTYHTIYVEKKNQSLVKITQSQQLLLATKFDKKTPPTYDRII
jgi:hypothetical protein